jgi:hypothetical protein
VVSEEQEQEKSRSSDGSDRGGSGADLHRKLVLGSAFDSWPSFKRFQFVAKQGGERPIIESGHIERRLHWMVPVEGLEPPRPHGHQILSLARLPIPPHRQVLGMYYARIKLAGKIVRRRDQTRGLPRVGRQTQN